MSVRRPRYDPLLCDFDLPLSAAFHPAGFPLRLATNSQEVLDAAAESWAPFAPFDDTPPLDFRVLISPEGPLAAEPTFRKQHHLLTFVSDARNFAAADDRTLSAAFHLSAATAANRAVLRWFYLDALAYMLLTQRYILSLHAACVAREGGAILICGPSAAGKSTLSFACARDGFTFLSDDCTWIPFGSDAPLAIGKPHLVRFRPDVARHFPELEGHLASVRPNGKNSIEVPTALFPEIRTAARCPIRALVFLNRESDAPAVLDAICAGDAETELLADLPSYGPEVNALHEQTVRGLAALPAWRLRYRGLEDAIRLMSEIAI
jgi:hypothetical protein